MTTSRGAGSIVSADLPERSAAGRWTWLRAGIAVLTVGWGTNQFTPLLLVYRAQLGLSATTVEIIFGLYALGLIPALLIGGLLSDRFGRRRMMMLGLLASGAASLLLIAGGSAVGLLFAGRLVAGLASGAAFGSGAAWINELTAAEGSGGRGSGARRVTVTMTAGFAAGPLVAGLLAQWAPAPTAVPYLPHLALVAVSVVLVLRAPETRTVSRATSVVGQLRMPQLRAGRFLSVVLPLAPWVFGSASIALAYLPALVEGSLGRDPLAFTAVLTMLTALAGILVQPLARRIDVPGSARLIGVSMSLVLTGVLLSAAAATTGRKTLVVLAILVLGAGYGACQVCGFQEIQRLATPESLAGLTAVYQAVSYLGFALPFLLAAAVRLAPPVVLLTAVGGLAFITLAWTVHSATVTPAGAATSSS